MGARQSKRSVDITTTPKKGEAEGSPVNEDKIEKLGDADVVEVVTNGTTAHTDIEFVVSFTLIFFLYLSNDIRIYADFHSWNTSAVMQSERGRSEPRKISVKMRVEGGIIFCFVCNKSRKKFG